MSVFSMDSQNQYSTGGQFNVPTGMRLPYFRCQTVLALLSMYSNCERVHRYRPGLEWRFAFPPLATLWITSCSVFFSSVFTVSLRLLSLSHRFTRVDKPGQHMFHELHCSGPNTHAAAARLLPLWPTQVWDAIKLLSGVWNVAALSGGTMRFACMNLIIRLIQSHNESKSLWS